MPCEMSSKLYEVVLVNNEIGRLALSSSQAPRSSSAPLISSVSEVSNYSDFSVMRRRYLLLAVKKRNSLHYYESAFPTQEISLGCISTIAAANCFLKSK